MFKRAASVLLHEAHPPHAETFSAVSHERSKVYYTDDNLRLLKLRARLKKLPDPREKGDQNGADASGAGAFVGGGR